MKLLTGEQIHNFFQPKSKKLGTFGGVFTPDVLTILDVIIVGGSINSYTCQTYGNIVFLKER